MGDVVAKKAAAETIMGDVDTTLTRARARGGKWAELAERLLANAIRLHGMAGAERDKAECELRALVAVVEAQDDAADKLIAQISDDVWNKIGRPAFDPTYFEGQKALAGEAGSGGSGFSGGATRLGQTCAWA